MKLIKVNDYDEMSEKACSFMMDRINRIDQPVLGLATGSTPEGMYKRLVEKYKQGEVSFQNVKSFNLDEYVGLEKTNPNSYSYFMKQHFV